MPSTHRHLIAAVTSTRNCSDPTPGPNPSDNPIHAVVWLSSQVARSALASAGRHLFWSKAGYTHARATRPRARTCIFTRTVRTRSITDKHTCAHAHGTRTRILIHTHAHARTHAHTANGWCTKCNMERRGVGARDQLYRIYPISKSIRLQNITCIDDDVWRFWIILWIIKIKSILP